MRSHYALIVLDFFNPMDFPGGEALAGPALRAARATARLKARLKRDRVPVIYANDNFGHWESEFSALVQRCCSVPGAPGEIARVLAPEPGDRSILKPRHSAFYGTPLEFVLDELGTRMLILTGVSADSCIMITAHDAHVRKFGVWVPRDCVAAQKAAYTREALAHIERVLSASIAPSRSPLPAAPKAGRAR